jgi:hypothetical protein
MKPIQRRSILKSIKPQVKARYEVQAHAVKVVAQWFMSEFELRGNQGHVLADAVVTAEIKRFTEACKNAPDVFLSNADTLELLVADSMKLAEEMDSRNELEGILANHQTREDVVKHGL